MTDAESLIAQLEALMEKVTPGEWSHCTSGCECTAVLSADHPVCEVTKGDWGDDYPSLRFKEGGPGHIGETSVEAYMAQATYGHVPVEMAMSNRAWIALLSPANIRTLLEALRTAERERDRANELLSGDEMLERAVLSAIAIGEMAALTARAEAAESALSARSREVERLREALRPFAAVAEHDIGHDEADADRFHPMHPSYSRAPSITVGDFRRARQALEAPHE